MSVDSVHGADIRREIYIISGLVVNPGDKVLLTTALPLSYEQIDEMTAHVRAWAPNVDWLVISGVDAAFQEAS